MSRVGHPMSLRMPRLSPMLRQFQRVLARTSEADQKLLLHMATKMARAKRTKP